jgi:hypothetical protein
MKKLLPSKDIYVQYGCGMSAPKEWFNFDASPNLFIERLPIIGLFYTGKKHLGGDPVRMKFPNTIQFGDIVKGLPLKKNSIKGIYASNRRCATSSSPSHKSLLV